MPLATEGTQERLARVWEWFEASSYEEGVGVDGGQQGTALHKKVGLGPTKIPLGETLKKSPR